jgi:hypothetical protein
MRVPPKVQVRMMSEPASANVDDQVLGWFAGFESHLLQIRSRRAVGNKDFAAL